MGERIHRVHGGGAGEEEYGELATGREWNGLEKEADICVDAGN